MGVNMKAKFKGYKNGKIFFILLMILMISSMQGIAGDIQLQSGKYIREGGGGSLIIKQGKDGALSLKSKRSGRMGTLAVWTVIF